VRPGETTELELAFEPTTERLIEVAFPDGVPASALELRVLDADGPRVRRHRRRRARRVATAPGRRTPARQLLRRGARADGRSATGELCVLDLAEDDTPLVLTLR
jgi:hypothetical protein